MKVNLNIEIDDNRVFEDIPEAERTDEMRDYVRSGLEHFYGTDDDNPVTEQLLMSAGGEIDDYLEQMREGSQCGRGKRNSTVADCGERRGDK